MSEPANKSALPLTVGTALTVLTLTIAGVTNLNATEATAARALEETKTLKGELVEVRRELRKQREMLAEVQGDSRAILKILEMQQRKMRSE
jgi:hypothetical protein